MTQNTLHNLGSKDGLDDSNLLRTLIDSLPEQVYVKDAEGRYVLNNLAHVRALGAASPEEVTGKSDFDFYPKELAERYHTDEQEAIRSGRALVSSEEPSQDKEGNKRWHSTTKVPLRDGSGTIVGLVGMTRDLTERKEAESALKESEEHLRSLTEAAFEGIAINEDGKILDANRAYASMFGYEVPELRGMEVLELHPPGTHDEVWQKISSGYEEPYESKGLRKDGTTFEVEIQGKTIPYEDRFVRITAIRDVTERKEAEEKHKESEERYRAVMEQSAEAIWVFDPETKQVLESNTAFQEMLGYSAEELHRMTNYDFVAHSDEDVDATVDRKVQKRRTTPAERRYRRKDGTVLDVEVNGTMISYGDKEVVCSVARDLTKRKEAEEALRKSEERFRSAFEDAPIGVTLVGLDRRYLRVNRALCEMLAYSEEELLKKTAPEIIHPDDREVSAKCARQALEEGLDSYTIERRYLCGDGRVTWNLTSVSLIRDSEGEPSHFVCLHEDTTERKELEEQLRHQAFYDSLTDLPNRSLFLDRLGHALARAGRQGGPSAVMFVDLDDFKTVNDSLGHNAGNATLIETAKRLKGSVRPGDTVGRIFGDEFAVLLEAPAGEEEAQRVARRIEERLREPFEAEGQEVSVGVSIGIALCETGEDDPEEVLRHADLAMYEAKKDGKAKYEVYDPDMTTRAVERVNLERDLRRAVEREEEFEVHYQPKMLLETGGIAGVEALVRWQHPDRGLLSASEFILLAEETGLINRIGLWVLKESCRQLKEWQERYPAKLGPPFGVCVNLSAEEIRQPDLADAVAGVLRETGLDPGCLMLEISERTAQEDAEQTIGRLRELKDLGVKLAIDDFGTGYCSLVYLEHSLLDVLKIDRLFVHRKREDPEECAAVISAMASMAHSLSLAVIVEGVETEEQLVKLKEMGCEMVQGHYFAEPLPGEAVETLLR